MPSLIPDQSGNVTFTIPAYDEDGDVLTLSSFTVLSINGTPQGSNPAWITANGVVTSAGVEEVDGRYRLDVTFTFNKNDVAVGLYVIELVVTDGVASISTTFSLDVQSTPFIPVPTSVSGMTGWFAADFEVQYGNGDVVESLNNQVAGNADLIQIVTDNKPSFVLSDSEAGGKPSIQFDGLDDFLYFDHGSGSTTATVFVVASLDAGSASGNRILMKLWSLSDEEETEIRFPADGEDLVMYWHDENGISTDTTVTLTEFGAKSAGMHIYCFVYSTATTSFQRVFRDGVIRSYWSSASGAINRTVNAIHCGIGMKGRIAEMISYNRAITASERNLVEIYLAQKYNLKIGPNPNFSPSDMASLHAWYKADSIGPGNITGSLVNTWPDSSGNAYDLVATGGLRPTLLTGVAAGNNSVKFNGAQSMQNSVIFAPVIPSTSTIMVVMKSDNLTSNVYTVIDGRQNGFRQRITLVEPQTIRLNQGTGDVTGSKDTSDYTVVVGSFGTTDNLWANDKIIGTGSAGSDTLDGITVGSDYLRTGDFLVGEVAEILVFNTQLSDGDVISLSNYLAWKYGVDFSYRSPNP